MLVLSDPDALSFHAKKAETGPLAEAMCATRTHFALLLSGWLRLCFQIVQAETTCHVSWLAIIS